MREHANGTAYTPAMGNGTTKKHPDGEEPEKEKTTFGKIKAVLWVIARIFIALGWLWLFICSIEILSAGFQVLGGAGLNTLLYENDTLEMPICGLMIGIFVTVLVQSSSTATSIVVTMVGAKIITVEAAIYMVMGANIGTTVTSTLVSFGQAGEPDEFERAFSCAALLAGFKWLAVILLIPIEVFTHMLRELTALCVQNVKAGADLGKITIMKTMTAPLVERIIHVNKTALGNFNHTGSFVKYCEHTINYINCTDFCTVGDDCDAKDAGPHHEEHPTTCHTMPEDYSCELYGSANETFPTLFTDSCVKREKHMWMNSCMTDPPIGGITVVLALILMFLALAMIVKTLRSILEGKIRVLIRENVSKDLPYPFGWLTGYFYMIASFGLTILVQSSSIFFAIITPMVGLDLITLERSYPIIIGSCLGTTSTSLIAALATTDGEFAASLQIALSHFFINFFGGLCFYVIPITREGPLGIGRFVGRRTAKYRWFAIMYLIVMYMAIPLIAFGLALIHEWVLLGLLLPMIFIGAFVLIVNGLRKCAPNILPKGLKSWKWLPAPFRSLEPYDRLCCSRLPCKCCKPREEDDEEKYHGEEHF